MASDINPYKKAIVQIGPVELQVSTFATFGDRAYFTLAINAGVCRIQTTITPENCDELIQALQAAQAHHKELVEHYCDPHD